MTVNGPEAARLVGNAVNEFGLRATRPVIYNLTSVALDVLADGMDHDSGVATLAYRWSFTPAGARVLLDVAVEALTATNPANPQE